jgi:autotransporter-associated beta strand protein
MKTHQHGNLSGGFGSTLRRPKTCYRLTLAACAAVGPLWAARGLAQSLTWDSSGSSPTFPYNGSGNWDTTDAFWSNGSADVVWDNMSTAVFGGAGSGSYADVTVDSPVTAAGITFNPFPGAGGYSISSDSNNDPITLISPTIAINYATKVEIDAPITGTVGLTLTGNSNATLSLTSLETYTGTTSVENGTLLMSGLVGSLPSGTPLSLGDSNNDSGTVELNGNSITVSSLQTVGTGANTIDNDGGFSALTYAGSNANPSTFSGNITDGGYTPGIGYAYLGLNVTSGSLTLTGNNTYHAGSAISSGATLQIGNGGASGNLPSGADVNGTLVFDQTGTTTSAGVIAGTGSLQQIGSGTVILTAQNIFSGTTTIANGATLQVDNSANPSVDATLGTGNVIDNGTLIWNVSYYGQNTINNNISGNGSLVLTAPQSTVLFLGGTSTNYGATVIANNEVILYAAGALSPNSALTLGDAGNDPAELNLNGQSVTVAGLNSIGTGTNNSGSGLIIYNDSNAGVTFTVAGSSGSSSTFAGSIRDLTDGYSGTIALTISGGSLTLSGANAYSGPTNVDDGGLLALNATGSINTGASEYIGVTAAGTFNQTGGTNSTSLSLVVGTQSGSVGDYVQSGGLAKFTGDLYLGFFAGASGAYSLGSTGALTVSGPEHIGNYGTGTFTQSGGTNASASNLDLGYYANASGVYNLGGGSLSVSEDNIAYGANSSGEILQSGGTQSVSTEENIGVSGAGTYIQTGGLNTLSGTFFIMAFGNNSTGTYNLSAGTLSATGQANIANASNTTATFNQTGGAVSFGSYFNLADGAPSTATYSLSGAGSTLTVSYEENIGTNGAGTFTQSGGTNTLNGPYFILALATNSTGVYNLSAGTLSTTGAAYIAYASNTTSTFNQTGGAASIGTYFNLAVGAGSTANYNLSGAGSTFTVGSEENIGTNGAGTFTQSGGTNAVDGTAFVIALATNSAGTYNLSAGTLAVAGAGIADIAFGNNTTATFDQSGGTASFAGDIYLAVGTGSTAAYSLSGTGALTVTGEEFIGDTGAGTLTQTSGTNTTSQDVVIASQSGSTGAYNLSAGALTSPSVYVGGNSTAAGGTGVLTISGTGSLNVAGSLTVYNTADSGLNVSGGTVTAAALNLLGGIYTQTAGSATFGQITGSGQVTISGGLTTLAKNGGASQVNSLTISGSGTLDITNNHIIIDYTTSDPISTIAGYLKSGYNGGAWNGPGIISSTAQTLTNGLRYAVGWADGANGVVSGLSSGQIEIKYTLLGDANLDGVVNGSDFSILAANFGKGVTNWDQGNFLYGSSVNGSDFSALAANFGQGDSGAAVAVSPADIAALDSFAVANGLPLPTFAAVPEPASAGLILAGITLTARRRRRPT